MNKFCYVILFFISITAFSQSHSVIGKWKTLDDETGKPVSVVEIFEKNKKIYGKVVEIFNPKTKVPRCEKCDGDDKNKPILGLIVIKGLTKDGKEYNNGKILDPKHGKIYKCFITLESKDVLKVRGFIGISLIGRTQFWERIK